MKKLMEYVDATDRGHADMAEVKRMVGSWLNTTTNECSVTLQMDFHVRPKEEQAVEWSLVRDQFVM